MREDLALMNYAKSLGFTPFQRKENAAEPYNFVRGRLHIWQCGNRLGIEGQLTNWAAAELNPTTNRYENHRYHPTLKEALEKESQ